jgi:hypothetical protein
MPEHAGADDDVPPIIAWVSPRIGVIASSAHFVRSY